VEEEEEEGFDSDKD
jgi:TfoX/Sxy family transcriptional regulator of competence genes